MEPFRVETMMGADGTLTLKDVPFRAGENVEVIIRRRRARPKAVERYPLRGKPLRYVDPFHSVAEGDWRSLR